MASKIKIKRSSTSGNKLTASNSEAGEFGLNTTDKALYVQTGTTNDTVITVYIDSLLHLDDTNDRVGIGTTTPAHKLDVDGNIAISGTEIVDSSGNWTGPNSGIKGGIGPTGAKGDQGDQGADGAAGPTGPTGPQGDKGSTGADGPQGSQGAKGDAGSQGPQGDKGNTGADGPQGPQGDKGQQGPQGGQGDKGPQGAAGLKVLRVIPVLKACWF